MNDLIVAAVISTLLFFGIKQIIPKPAESEISAPVYRKAVVKDAALAGLVCLVAVWMCKHIAPLKAITAAASGNKVKSASAFTKAADF